MSLIRWLLAWFFPVWAMLPRARALGAVSFTEVAGVGWQCTIRPASGTPGSGRLNCWTGQGATLGRALIDAIGAATVQRADHVPSPFAPRLGGAEFDADE